MSKTVCQAEQWTLFEVERREVTIVFDEGDVVTDTGLLTVRKLDQELGILAEAAARLPDPRSELTSTDSTEDLLTQEVYQFLGGYFDSNVAQRLRHNPALQTMLDRAPEVEILVRADSGDAVPGLYEFCESHDLNYVIGSSASTPHGPRPASRIGGFNWRNRVLAGSGEGNLL